MAERLSDDFVDIEAFGLYRMAVSTFLASRGCEVALIVPVQVLAVRRLKGLDREKNDRLGVCSVAEALRIG